MRRLVGVLVVLAAALSATGCGRSCDTSGETGQRSTIEGELIDRTIVGERFRRSVNDITIQTDDGDVDVRVSGRPELLDVGQRYEIDLVSYDDDELPQAFLDADSGCSSGVTTIRLVNDDDSTSPIEIPGLLPSSPISLRTFFLGFIGFVVLIAVFGRSRPSD